MRILLSEIYSKQKFAFHVTPTKNLNSILKNGLLPSHSGIGDGKGIYLFPDKIALQDALMNWLGDKFDDNEQLSLLKVNIDDFELESDSEYEIRITKRIPPNLISIEEYNV